MIVSNVSTVDKGGVGFMLVISKMHENMVNTPEMIGSDFACLFRIWCRAKMPPIVVEGYHCSGETEKVVGGKKMFYVFVFYGFCGFVILFG